MPQGIPAKLRVVVLYSTGHAGSAIVLNRLLQSPDLEVVGLIRSAPLPSGKKTLKKRLQKMGWQFSWLLVWQRVAQIVQYGIATILHPIFPRKRALPGWYMVQERAIPWHRAKNINDAACENFIAKLKPDLVVSAYFNQILKENILKIPRLGTLNIHPGILPAYKGVMSYFWVLKNNSDRAGVTLHWINEGIDTGATVARKSFAVRPDTTQHQVLVKSAVIGGFLAVCAAAKLRRGEPPATLQEPLGAGDYYSMPEQADFDAYFRHRRFFRLRDIFSALWR